jgi:hypothetical protein
MSFEPTSGPLYNEPAALLSLLSRHVSRLSGRFLFNLAERPPVPGTPIVTRHKHRESLVAPPRCATHRAYRLALRVELRALAGRRVHHMSGRHMVRAVDGSLAGTANMCFLQ